MRAHAIPTSGFGSNRKRSLGWIAAAIGATLGLGAFAGPASAQNAPPEVRAAVLKAGCGGCHTIPGVPGAAGLVGPNLGGRGS